jgi:copper chaperone CopZ
MWELKVDGMDNDRAAATITGAILRVDPGAQVNVDINAKMVQVRSLWREAEIRAVLENAGYSVREARMVA